MDDLRVGGEELREALRHLRRLNRIFGASGPALYGVRTLWGEAGKPGRLTILDVGSGSGELNRRILRWGDRQGMDLKVTLADVTDEAEAESKRIYRNEPRVRFEKRSVFELRHGEADIVTASQFLHHFPTEELPAVLDRMLAAARIGVVIHDLHRHWLPWTAVWVAVRCFSRNRCIRHDGPLSVAKGFRGPEFRDLAARLNGAGLICRWRPLFRYTVTLRKSRTGGRGG
ncbi:methyltransferase domain-containing protein [Cohnella caldifontis]|uniref:methyltransferase domain-containing protein n=1 Tax=Cohnella caldifontis TaxID=3027471 RepID=UPI0023EC5C26|nr:methyltransferase domain-containing protein [Cohnella sp. YIM B05605]